MHVGIAGTGKMGTAIGRRLLASGHDVSAWNRTRERAAPLLEHGANWIDSPQALASGCDIVITMVTDGAALTQVYQGPQGLLTAPPAGRLFVDMSTVKPQLQRELGAAVAAAGARYLECPVGGSVGPALEGRLLGFVGGLTADLEDARPLLEALCRRLEYVGPLGSGALMKLAINLPLMVYWQTLGEALSLLQPLGLEPARVIDILAETSGGPNMLKVRGPMIARALAGDAGGPISVDLATMRKDVRSMLEQAGELGCRLPLTATVLASFDQAAGRGLDGADCTQLPVWWLHEGGRA